MGKHLNPRKQVPILERLMRKIYVDPETGCWLWGGGLQEDGYGVISRGKKEEGQALVHRVSFEAFKGNIPEGYEVDHVCHDSKKCTLKDKCPHRRCFNPEHLEAAEKEENNKRSSSPTAINSAKTHCRMGHEFSAENTYFFRNRRICRLCSNLRKKRWRAA
jgi:hypothetical protein